MKPPILMVTRSTPLHGIGGFEQATWDLAVALEASGHPMTLLTTEIHPTAPLPASPRVVTVPGAPPGALGKAWAEGAPRAARDLCGSDGILLGTGHSALGMFPRVPGAGLHANQWHGTRRVELQRFGPRGRREAPGLLHPRHLRMVAAELRHLSRTQCNLAVGPNVRDALQSLPYRLALRSEPHTIPNGIDVDAFRPDAARRQRQREAFGLEGPVVLSAGRLVRKKGLAFVLRAFRVLLQSESSATLLVLGDGPERGIFESQAAALGLTGRVRFLGALPRKVVPDIYRAADALLFSPAGFEVQPPLVVLEALACGVPVCTLPHVVGSSLAGVSGVFTFGWGDEGASVRALAQALEQPRSDVGLPVEFGLPTVARRVSHVLTAALER